MFRSLIFINYVFNYELHYILNYVFNYFSDPLCLFLIYCNRGNDYFLNGPYVQCLSGGDIRSHYQNHKIGINTLIISSLLGLVCGSEHVTMTSLCHRVMSKSEKSRVLAENSKFSFEIFKSDFENSNFFPEKTLRKTIIYLKYNL